MGAPGRPSQAHAVPPALVPSLSAKGGAFQHPLEVLNALYGRFGNYIPARFCRRQMVVRVFRAVGSASMNGRMEGKMEKNTTWISHGAISNFSRGQKIFS